MLASVVRSSSSLVALPLLAAALAGTSACAGAQARPEPTVTTELRGDAPTPARAAVVTEAVAEAPRAPAPCQAPARVQFGFDSAALDEPARAALAVVADCLQRPSAAPARVVIQGHSDERGTAEYNMVLGMRRADAVRGYLEAAGVEPDRLQATSFGEERPLDRRPMEAGWSRNRRAELQGLATAAPAN